MFGLYDAVLDCFKKCAGRFGECGIALPDQSVAGGQWWEKGAKTDTAIQPGGKQILNGQEISKAAGDETGGIAMNDVVSGCYMEMLHIDARPEGNHPLQAHAPVEDQRHRLKIRL